MKRNHILFFFLLLLLSSCAVTVNDSRTKPALPTAFHSEGITGQTLPDTAQMIKWWDLYKDPVLKQLIKMALDSNRNLLAAGAKVEQARLNAANAKVNMYPSFGYAAQAGLGSVGIDAQRTGTALDGGVMKLYGSFNWEVDLWGKLKNNSLAAAQDFLAIQSNRNALQASLVADVASYYFLVRDLDNRLSIAQRTLEGRKGSTLINGQRFKEGFSPELDLLQAQQQEDLAAVTIPAFKRAINQAENAIGLLTSNYQDTLPRGLTNYNQDMVPVIPSGLSSQLLQRRPDIRAAEAQFQGELARVGVAKASLYPSFSLTGLLGFASPQLSTLISGSGFVATGLAGLTGPIFNFGLNKRRIAIQEQRVKESGYLYEQVVIAAFREVNVALTQYRTFGEEYTIRKKQTEEARKALVLSRARYDYGYTSYLEVLIQETNLFDAELSSSIALQQQLTAVSNLYKALGGGW
jgi:multidrug efflux system outer membrane protein